MASAFLKRVSSWFPQKTTSSVKASGRKRQLYGFSHSQPAWLASESLESRTLLAAAFPEFVDPNPATGNQFGAQVVPLSTGNVVITSPSDDAGGTDAGAVYLFNGATGALISTLRGSTANNNIGSGGVTTLTNGNYVVKSPLWDNGTATDAGAATWGSGTLGISGSVSSTNSLVGTTAANSVSSGGVIALTNGNYVVNSSLWDNGAVINAGAVTWGSGTTGVKGSVGSANSLVGSVYGDMVGLGGATELTNGNYVVASSNWDNGAATDAGAVTWGSGTSGVKGVVSSTNSLVGGASENAVGSGGVIELTNGNYVVASPYWDNTATFYVGAVTWGSGTSGIKGVISTSNSLVGSSTSDNVGKDGVTALTNGNYVVRSSGWDNGSTPNAGAVTWGNGTAGVKGFVSSSNSLVGSTANNSVGSGEVQALSNGNYVVSSPNWDNGSSANAGAVTWGSGTTGVKGTVTSSNSLVGSSANNQVGSGGVTPLSNGNYVVASPNWDNGSLTNTGAVTWGSGTTGVKGTVGSSNSLVGSSANNVVGSSGVTRLNNGNYVVASPNWDNGRGAVTWANGLIGIAGSVSSANSLIGSTANDSLGSKTVEPLTNGNYVVSSPDWDNGTATNAGAVTWASGATGLSGTVSIQNSLVGTATDHRVGSGFVTALINGNYVVTSPTWDNGILNDVGAATWGSGVTGVVGPLSTLNSLVGSSAFDTVGYSVGYYYDQFGFPIQYPVNGIYALSNGNYLVESPYFKNGTSTLAGAATFGDGATGIVGYPSESNSAIGQSAFGNLFLSAKDDSNQQFYARFINERSGVVRVGSQVDGFPKMAISLIAGNLVIDAREGNNQLTVSRVGGNLVITDPLELFGAAPDGGTLSNNNHTLTIPIASITGSITINGGGGDDTLAIDLNGGDPISNGGLIFHGNDPVVGLGDTLKIIGGDQGTVTYNYTNSHDGAVVLSNYGTISYTGLEPIINSGTATNVIFNLPAGTNDVTLSDDGTIGNNLSRLLGLSFETTYFANPTGSLTIQSGSVDDVIFVDDLPDFDANIEVGTNANPFQSVEWGGTVSLTGLSWISALARIIVVNAPLTTASGDISLIATNDITLNDAVVTGAGNLQLTADSDNFESGSVSVAAPNFGNWTFPAAETFLNSTGSLAGDSAGGSVAISKDGNTAVVGAYFDDVGLNIDQGSAIVYVRSGGAWIEQARLTSSSGAADDRFGSAVALSSDGNTAVVGAYVDDVGANGNEGSVTAFVRVAGVWTEQALLTAADGEASDTFGVSVDLSNDGNTLVVGAYLDNVGSAGNAGSVTIFTRTGSTWTQQAKVVAADGAVDDRLGFSVAVSGDGNTLISGAYLDDIGAATRRGSAYVFTRSGVTWTQQSQLLASDGLAQDRFGTAVDISDDGLTSLVGGHLIDVGGRADQGAAYVYTRTGSVWTQRSKLTASDGAASDYFGYSVSLSGDGNTALVGSRQDDVGANVDQGSATIYTRNGVLWTQRKQFVATGGSAEGNFGITSALDRDGSTIFLGAYIDDVGPSINQGSASIFDRADDTPGGTLQSSTGHMSLSGVSADLQGAIISVGGDIAINTNNGITLRNRLESGGGNVTLNADFDANGSGTATLTTAALGLFAQRQQLTDSIGAASDNFGRSVAISDDGSTAIVGSFLDDVGANVDQGSVKIYIRSGNAWIEQQQLFGTGGAAGDRFGFSVALSSDGNTAIVGAYFDKIGANATQGSVTIFTRAAGTWSQQQQISSVTGAADDRFGYSVALSSDGNTAIVGAYTDDVGANSNQGSATVFTRTGSAWTQQQQLTQSGGAGSDSFGISVALSSDGNTAIVGAYADDVGSNSNQGSAVIFKRSGSVWTQQQQINAADGAASDLFGVSVALSSDGSTAAVGAYQDDIGLNAEQGSVTFFTRSGSVWTQQQQVFASDGSASAYFGRSLDLTSDGNTAIIGTVFDDPDGNVNQGSATVYTRAGGVWSPQQQVISSSEHLVNEFGIGVALSGDGLTLIIGAEATDVGANADQGASFIFTRTAGSVSSGPGNGAIQISAADVNFQGNVVSSSTVSIDTPQANRPINLGTDTAGSLSLTETELDFMSAATLQIGGANSGQVTVSGSISRSAATNLLFESPEGITINTGVNVNSAGGTISPLSSVMTILGSVTGPLEVPTGGLLKGTGTTSAITTENGAAIAPGTSRGILNSGDVSLSGGSYFNVELYGTTVGTKYGQLNVTGAVTLNNANLNIALGYVPNEGDTFTIINNDGTDTVLGSGTFQVGGLTIPDGGSFFLQGYRFFVDYSAGLNSNDVTLTVHINQAPTALNLSSTLIVENNLANADVGLFSATDPDANPGDTFTYTLETGIGSADNSGFTLMGNRLTANTAFDFETKSSYSIRVRSTDPGGLSTVKIFTISVLNVLDGTSSIDQFDIAVSVNSVSVTRISNGAPPVAEGTFTLTPQLLLDGLTITGLDATDVVKLRGLTGNDSFNMAGAAIVLNGLKVTAGQAAKATLDGGAGDDVYGFKADQALNSVTITDSAGMDTVDFSATTVDISANLDVSSVQTVCPGLSLIVPSNTIENLIGGSGDDLLTGNALSNLLRGNAGNDTLNGFKGNDTLVGGIGNDSYVFGSSSPNEQDVLTEFAFQGIDMLRFSSLSVNVQLDLGSTSAQVVHVNRTITLNSGTAFENAVGGSGSDWLIGNSAKNLLSGKGGHDILNGLGGNDSLIGGPGDDSYLFAAVAMAEADTLTELDNEGVDGLFFATLTTAVNLNLGTSSVQSVHANRTLKLSSFQTFENATGGTGDDVLRGNSLTNILTGNNGNDVLVGNSGNDTLLGGIGRDILIGGMGLDTLDGGGDDDILIAGRTSHDSNEVNLNDLRLGWTSAGDYITRVTQLRAGVGGTSAALKAKVTVINDAGDDDLLTGGTGEDWFLKAADDLITDLLLGELLDVL